MHIYDSMKAKLPIINILDGRIEMQYGCTCRCNRDVLYSNYLENKGFIII